MWEVFDDLKRSPRTSFDFILHFRSSTYSTSNMSVLQSAASGMHQMAMMDGRGGAMLPPPPHLQYPSHNSTASQQSAQQPKYPPPLIPVNGSNQRWEAFYFSSGASFGNWKGLKPSSRFKLVWGNWPYESFINNNNTLTPRNYPILIGQSSFE